MKTAEGGYAQKLILLEANIEVMVIITAAGYSLRTRVFREVLLSFPNRKVLFPAGPWQPFCIPLAGGQTKLPQAAYRGQAQMGPDKTGLSCPCLLVWSPWSDSRHSHPLIFFFLKICIETAGTAGVLQGQALGTWCMFSSPPQGGALTCLQGFIT